MAEELTGLGSKLFIGNKDTGEVFSLDFYSNEAIRLKKSYHEEELDRVKAKRQSMPPGIILPKEDGGFVLQELKAPKTMPSLSETIEEPFVWKNDYRDIHGHPRQVFSFTGTFELADGAEAEIIRDMMRREMPEPLFDVHILPSQYRKCYGRAPRKILKAMNHGGYYKRNTKWKRKSIALFNRYPEQSPFTICNAKIETDEDGRVTICAGNRGGLKNNLR